MEAAPGSGPCDTRDWARLRVRWTDMVLTQDPRVLETQINYLILFASLTRSARGSLISLYY